MPQLFNNKIDFQPLNKSNKLPEGFEIDQEGSTSLPDGFEIDNNQSVAELPEGFVIDENQTTTKGEDSLRELLSQDAANVIRPSDTGIRGLAAGAGSTIEAGGHLLDLITQASPTNKAAKELSQLTGIPEKDNPLIAYGKDVQNKFKMLPSDNPLTYKIAAAFGSSIPMMAPGVGVAAGMVKSGAGYAKAASVASGVSAALESGLEAGGVSGELKQEGKSQEDINKKAAFVFATNLPLLYVTDKLGGLFDLAGGKKAILSIGKTAFFEGGQEGGQQVISNVATDKPITEGVGESVLLGGLVGGSMSGIMHLATNIDSRKDREVVYNQFKQDVDTGVIELYDELGQPIDLTGKERQLFDSIVAEAEKSQLKQQGVVNEKSKGQEANKEVLTEKPSEMAAIPMTEGSKESLAKVDIGQEPKYKLSEYEQKMKEFGQPVKKAGLPDIGQEVSVDNQIYKVTRLNAGKTGDMIEGQDLGGNKKLFAVGQIQEQPKYKTADIFYSQVSKVIEDKMPNAATPEMIKGILSEKNGVKTEELKWLGVDEFLDGKQKVTKQELQNYIKQNQVEINYIEKAQEQRKFTKIDEERLRYLQNLNEKNPLGAIEDIESGSWSELLTLENIRDKSTMESLSQEYKRLETIARKTQKNSDWNKALHIQARMEELDLSPAGQGGLRDDTKFGKYQLLGGSNYRELLLTLPIKQTQGLPFEDYLKSYRERFPDSNETDESVRDFYNKGVYIPAIGRLTSKQEGYRSPHFDERNILAHIRMNDRVDADGKKVLFIEEVQSDWHQQGRKEGYKNKQYVVTYKTKNGIETKEFNTKVEAENFLPTVNASAAGIREINNGSVPDAPFKKSWQELAMKRMLRYAAENGYDKLAWTTGEQQAERYDLSKHISEITASHSSRGTIYLRMNDKDGGVINVPNPHVEKENLDEFVGKDLADKIRKDVGLGKNQEKVKTYSGLDLKIGGEGMKGFYDQILPSFMNKYAKKWGARVGESRINTKDSSIGMEGSDARVESSTALVHSVDITPSMKESVLSEGQPMFKKQPTWEELKKDVKEVERLNKEGRDLIAKILPELLDTFEQPAFLYTKEGKKALGLYVSGNIKVVSGSKLEIYIHEVGHAVFDMFLTPQERESLLNEIKSKYDITDNLVAEEQMMDDFEEYFKARSEIGRTPTLSDKIAKFFDKLFRAIKKFFGVDKMRVEQFYESVLSGEFREYKKPNRFESTSKYKEKGDSEYKPWIDKKLSKKIGDLESRKEKVASVEMDIEQLKTELDYVKEVNDFLRKRINPNKNADISEEVKEIPKELFTNNPEGLSADEALAEVNNAGLGLQFETLRDMAQFYQTSIEKEKMLKIKIENRKNYIKAKKPQFVTKREDTIVKQEVAMAKRGYEQGVKITKLSENVKRRELIDKLKQAFSSKMANREDVIKSLKDYVVANVEPSARGRFIPLIVNSKSANQISEAFRRIDEYVSNKAKVNAAKKVSELIDKLLNSPNVGVEYKDAIKALVNDVDLVNRKPDTIRKIIALQEDINKRKEKGDDVYLSQNVVNKLALLIKVPFKDVTILDMEGLYQQLQDLGREAERAVMQRRNAYELEKAHKKSIIIQHAKPIRSMLSKVKYADKVFDVKANPFYEAYVKAYNAGKYTDISLSPMNVLFDMLDGGGARYDGEIYTALKRPIDIHYSSYLNTRDKLLLPVFKKAQELNISEKSLNRVGIYSISRQVGGYERLIESGLTDEQIKSIQLTDKEKDLYKTIQDNFKKIYPILSGAMRDVYNKEVGFVKNYSPFMRDSSEFVNEEIDARFSVSKNNVSHGMAEERSEFTPKNRPLNTNILDVYTAYADNVAYLAEMGEQSKMFGEVINDPDVKNALGDMGSQALREYADLIARKGGSAGAIQDKVVDLIKRNLSIGVFGLKLSSALIQTSSVLNGGMQIGRYSVHGLVEYLGNKDVRNFVYNNMPEVRNRIGDDPAYLEKFLGKKMESVRQFALMAMTANDKISASGVAWGAYLYSLRKQGKTFNPNVPDQEAIDFAQRVVVQTQSTSQFKDLPLTLSYGRLLKGKNKATGSEMRLLSYERAFWQFQNYMLSSQWSPLRYDLVEKIKTRQLGDVWKIAFYMTLGTVAGIALRDLAKIIGRSVTGFEPDDKKKEDESFRKDIEREIIQKIPFVSQIVSLAMYSQFPVPVLETGKDVVTGVGRLIKSKEESSKLKAGADVIGAGLSIAGLPSSQAVIVAKEIIDSKDPKKIKDSIEEEFYKTKDKSILNKAVESGIINTKQKIEIIKSSRLSPLERKTKSWSYDKVITEIEKAPKESKRELAIIAGRKILNKLDDSSSEERKELRELRNNLLKKYVK